MYTVPTNKKDIWNPYFYKDNPLFTSILPLWSQVVANFLTDWPAPHDYVDIAQSFRPPSENSLFKFIPQTIQPYVQTIYQEKTIPTRTHNWHDFFNNLTWIVWPKMKWAIVEKIYQGSQSNIVRTPQQNLLAHFDECGIVLCSDKPELFAEVEAFRWKNFFWQNPLLLKHCLPIIMGHGLLEKALHPYIGMTGKAIFLQVPSVFFKWSTQEQLQWVDSQMANYISSPAFPESPQSLHPFPLLGWPGWHPDNQQESFYDNAKYFRSGRKLGRVDKVTFPA